MHLERTARPATLPISNLKKRMFRLLIVAVCGLAIVGCAEGTANDAERGRERDAERTSVVDDLQSTRTSELINGTPNASPTATP